MFKKADSSTNERSEVFSNLIIFLVDLFKNAGSFSNETSEGCVIIA